MLNRDEIQKLLYQGGIFRKDTWTASALSPAAYDLRMAEDFLIDAEGTRFHVGDIVSEVTLKPGQVALVSTMERFCIPWDVVGNMSPKFSMAKKGIMVHTGSIVDPGFGLTLKQKKWEAKDDERVHFYLANVGQKTETLRPGDKIATLQFARIAEPKDKVESPTSREKIKASLFDKIGAPLSLDLFWYLKNQQSKNLDEFKALEKQIAEMRAELGTVKSGYQQITYFGIYVLGAALITIFATPIFSGNTTSPIAENAPWWAKILFSAAALFLLGVPVWLIVLLRGKERPPTSPLKHHRFRRHRH